MARPVNSEQLPAFHTGGECSYILRFYFQPTVIMQCSQLTRMVQEVLSRSLKPSRRSPSSSFYSASESQLLLLNRLNHLFPTLIWRLLCRRLHLATSLRMCLRRRLIIQTRFRAMWPFRRLSLVPLPYHWMLLRRRSHPALCLSMSLRRWVLAQLPRFLLMRLCRILHIVLY